ncbi:MAG: putative metallo-hydrolase YycJ [Chlamydiia bacterium]|nr:putative metallo-hydrolase YycJ [Chlamydiia bacterium]
MVYIQKAKNCQTKFLLEEYFGCILSFMIHFCPLASGSKGNATYVAYQQTRLLVDCGLSYKALTEKLAEIDVDPATLDAVLISHEHTDHIKGIDQLAKRHNLPVLCNADTARAIISSVKVRPTFKIFASGERFVYGDIEITPFTIQHDTLDPVMFTFMMGETKIGICTDLGMVTSLVRANLEGCHVLLLEANHDEEMVHACNRSMHYKQRVLSKQGHLSNRAAAALLKEIYHDKMERVYLGHLSGECNNPKVALGTVREVLQAHSISLELEIAHQDRVSSSLPINK